MLFEIAIVLEYSLILILLGETTFDTKGGIIIACDLEGLIVRQFLLIQWDTLESFSFILISSSHILEALINKVESKSQGILFKQFCRSLI